MLWSEFHEDLARRLSRLSPKREYQDRIQDARLCILEAIESGRSPFYARQLLRNLAQKEWSTLRSKVDLVDVEEIDRNFSSTVMSPFRFTYLREIFKNPAELSILDQAPGAWSKGGREAARRFLERR